VDRTDALPFDACPQAQASVTLIWRDTDENLLQFEEELADSGLQCLQGARWHILDARCGKDVAVNWLIERYREQEDIEPTTLGLGDGPNDAPLLDSVDFAVVIKGINRQGITLRDDNPARVYHTQQPAAGWQEGLDHFLPDPATRPGYARSAWPDTAGRPPRTAAVQNSLPFFIRAADAQRRADAQGRALLHQDLLTVDAATNAFGDAPRLLQAKTGQDHAKLFPADAPGHVILA
jgi:hypothetical protein